ANAVQYARNANATINGVSVSSATNTLADTVAGLTLTLSQLTTAPVEIAIATDNTALKSGINGFVSAYNAMNQMLSSATKYDASTKQAALLQGDSVTVGLQNALRTLAASVTSGSGPQRLSDIGITLAKDGTGNLSVDAGKLDAALRSPKAVAAFFMAPASGGDPSSAGFAVRFSAFTQAAVGNEGSIASRTGSLQLQKTGNGREQDRLSDRLTLTESRLRKQYSALDANLSKLTALDTFVSQQIAQWNRSKD
ncbi:MAG: flagellar cap protein FliD, partial [Comamonadaceae bacterium]